MAQNVIVMHGSKNEERNTALESRLDALMKPHAQYAVAFIESREQSLFRVVSKLAEEGERNFHIIPLLFFSASHYSSDIPDALKRLEERYRNLQWSVAPPVGTHPSMARFVESRVAECTSKRATIIVMAHGNENYPEADHELERLVANLDVDVPVHAATLYGALSIEHLSGRLDGEDIVIVPIALEDGFLTGKMAQAVDRHLPGCSATFTPSVNFNPILADILSDHMV